MRKRSAALLLGVVALSAGCRGRDAAETVRLPAGSPVVLISIDTLRSDRLPAYGYEGVETPAIDDLRRESVLFANAYCHAPLTLPSHASMFTGLLPTEHGVRDNIGYRLDTTQLPYLPTILKQAGYATGAAVSAFVLRGDTGLDSGFDLYDDEVQTLSWTGQLTAQRSGRETLARAIDWLGDVHDRPFFLFFHIYEPHTPRAPPAPFSGRYVSAYDGEVAASDAIVGELLSELRQLGAYDRAIVILTSDHGEGLEDHEEDEHGVLIYREALQVPLLIKLPGGRRAGETIQAPAQLIDLTPTLLQLLDMDVPAGLRGRYLLAAVPSETPRIYAESLYPRLHFGWSDLESLIEYPYHLIWGPDPELYDLSQDPAERRNLVRREQRLAAELRRSLQELERPFQRPVEADAEVQRQLAALGYIGSLAAEPEGPLADPKSRLHVLKDLRTAFNHFRRAEYEQAVQQFRRGLAEEPGMVDAWGQLGHALMALGRFQEALDAFERGFELSGGAPRLAVAMGGALLKLGQLQQARSHAELAVTAGEDVSELLARIALAEDDLDEAERQIDRGLQRTANRPSLLILKAMVALQRGDLSATLQHAAAAEQALPPGADRRQLSGLYFARGEAHARSGEIDKAELAFREEISITPHDLPPYSRLALLYVLSDRPREATSVLRRMLDANPQPAAFLEAVQTLRVVGDERSAQIVLGEALRRWPDHPELRKAV